jgi:hypothetical protein
MKKLIFLCLVATIFWLAFSSFSKKETAQEEKTRPEPTVTVLRNDSPFPSFGTKTLKPDFFLASTGIELEAPEFLENKDPQKTLLFVTAKESRHIEAWPFPFQGTEAKIFPQEDSPNGLVIDHEGQRLFATNSQDRTVEVFSVPEFSLVSTFGDGILGSGENNVDILTLPDGSRRLYVTDNNEIFGLDRETGVHILNFKPKVESIEEILADSRHQILYVPDEQGGTSDLHPGGAILAFYPDGTPYEKDGSNIFAQGLYGGDGEGITLYRCFDHEGADTGRGFIISTDQQTGKENGFEFFDRESWKHLGTLHLEGVEQTDGIDVTERPLPGYKAGLFVAINNDKDISLTSWERVIETTGLVCPQ